MSVPIPVAAEAVCAARPACRRAGAGAPPPRSNDLGPWRRAVPPSRGQLAADALDGRPKPCEPSRPLASAGGWPPRGPRLRVGAVWVSGSRRLGSWPRSAAASAWRTSSAGPGTTPATPDAGAPFAASPSASRRSASGTGSSTTAPKRLRSTPRSQTSKASLRPPDGAPDGAAGGVAGADGFTSAMATQCLVARCTRSRGRCQRPTRRGVRRHRSASAASPPLDLCRRAGVTDQNRKPPKRPRSPSSSRRFISRSADAVA
jgi:hypothetical protein